METNATLRRAATQAVLNASVAVRALELPPEGTFVRDGALEVAEIVRALDADESIVIAAMLGPLLEGEFLDAQTAVQRFGAEPVRLARELLQLGHFGMPPDWTPEQGLASGQTEALRKMLLAVVGDVRLVVVRLAEQLQKMRAAKGLNPVTQRSLAIESREVYAPLANRLGIWHLKWELEDLAFRYLQGAEYRRIASALKSRRAEREQYIERLKAELDASLQAAGIDAAIEARPKHIYSIWRKMQAKGLAFAELMDIRAARVLVGTVADCYAALGVVHSLWQFIPGEFDDYIATPKDNLYRSIHTAVIGPEGEPVEIQIRTHEMHASAESGVASHWRYKEGGRGNQAYERKIDQLRALLAPAEAADNSRDFLDRMRIDLFHDRIYLLSPRGAIVDVPIGGTPLDFAYQLHSDLGHRTRGAKVNGRIVPLDYQLRNGETVEIITGKNPQPSRDWLSPQSGFLASPRNRNKVRAWFRRLDEAQNKLEGKSILERELARLGLRQLPMPALLAEMKLARSDALHASLGLGEITAAQLAGAIQRVQHARAEPAGAAPRARPAPEPQPDLAVQGIGDLLSSFARCCRPVPPEPIVGYITVGRGVSVHAESCANIRRLRTRAPARLLPVNWGGLEHGHFPVAIQVDAFDRRGLLRDVSAVLADQKISIQGITTTAGQGDHIAHMDIGISIDGLSQLARVLARIAQVPNVIAARRRK